MMKQWKAQSNAALTSQTSTVTRAQDMHTPPYPLISRRPFLKIDDATVIGNVDRQTFTPKRLNLAIDGLTESVTDFVELFIERFFVSAVSLHC
jgi:hypothetical protein